MTGQNPCRAGVGLAAIACAGLAGCMPIGQARLGEDQTGYSRALTESQKQQTLQNIVQLRYGDTPTFLDATQIISGYQLQRSVSGGFQAFPAADPNTYLSGGGAVQLQESPTFTFQPVVGEQFAQSFIRPLSPIDLLPLSLSGLPIDVLFRLAVQSVNGLENATPLTQSNGEGTPGFFRLLHDLRQLQIAGLLGVRQAPESRMEKSDPKKPASERTEITVGSSDDPALQAIVVETRRLLGLPASAVSAAVTYGRAPSHKGDVAILTRSMLGVIGSIAFDIDVPKDDVARGRTVASLGLGSFETHRLIRVRTSETRPDDAFATVAYRHHWFWVSNEDFDSKVAFTLLQLLLQLAKTGGAPGAVITIPAG